MITYFGTGTWLTFLSPFWPSAVGAVCSLYCLGETLSLRQKLSSFLIGVGSAVFVAPAIIEIFAITGPKTQICIDFLVGLFALAIISQIFKEIQSADLIGALKHRFFRDS